MRRSIGIFFSLENHSLFYFTLAPPQDDENGSPRNFRKDELLQFLRDLGQTSNLSLEDKAQLFAAKLSESMHRSRMHYRIQGARMLTGGKSLFLNLPDKLQEVGSKRKRENKSSLI